MGGPVGNNRLVGGELRRTAKILLVAQSVNVEADGRLGNGGWEGDVRESATHLLGVLRVSTLGRTVALALLRRTLMIVVVRRHFRDDESVAVAV